MKNYLYIATITAIILASVGMVTAYPTTNQDALPSFVLKTKIAKDSIHKEVFDHSGFNALLQKNVSAEGKVNYKAFKKDQDCTAHVLACTWQKNTYRELEQTGKTSLLDQCI